MKFIKKMLVVIFGLILVAGMQSYASSSHSVIKELTTDISSIMATTYGTYAYSTYYNDSDTGRGDIAGQFQCYINYTWQNVEPIAYVSEGHFHETNMGGTSSWVVRNFRSSISAVTNYSNPQGYENLLREGLVVIVAWLPDEN